MRAGLWTKWKDPKSGDEALSCTILTCAPNDVMAGLHNRMPVADGDWLKWLGEEPATQDELFALLKPRPDNVLKVRPVNKAVSKSGTRDRKPCIEKATAAKQSASPIRGNRKRGSGSFDRSAG
jgi:putative SOS response-associated peptidase YedK